MDDDDTYTDAGHDYVSAACWHAQHGACPGTCEWCDATCRCACHVEHEAGSIGELISESSLGTDTAMAMRARTPRGVAEEIVRRSRM